MKIHMDLLQLLRLFSLKENDSQVPLKNFQDYLRKYAKHYLNQNPGLSKYLEISTENLTKELRDLQTSGQIEFISDISNNINIFVPQYHLDFISKLYAEIKERADIPFPLLTDLPRSFPSKFLRQIMVSEDFASLKENPDGKEFLYSLNYSGDTPSIVFPGTYSAEKILSYALAKIKFFLSKDEAREYMQKRLSLANPGKEFTVRTFISQIMAQTVTGFQSTGNSNETYIFWGQFCTFIKQEFAKKNEKLPDEIALLQSIGIVEYLNNYYRNSVQKDIQSETAVKNLSLAFQRAPYYFTMKQITEFKDSRGIPLLGQYTEETLQEFMKKKTSEAEKSGIPEILTFTNSLGERFYVLAEKIVPLLISLITDARKPIREACINKWHSDFVNFEQHDSMKNDAEFGKFLKSITAEAAPDLYALLNASFVSAMASSADLNDVQILEMSRIFPEGKIAPYQEILMLNRTELVNDTKILLPFWYTIPFIFNIIAFFKKKNKAKQNKKSNKSNKTSKDTVSAKHKITMKDIAEKLESSFLTEGMSLEEALERKLDGWNQNLNPTARNNLTEDINSLIRDYIRGIQKTLSPSNFTEERIESLAQNLVDTPSLKKIKNKSALKGYAELYILKLVKKYF